MLYNVHSFYALFILGLVLPCCGSEAPPTFQKRQLVCPEDGFCIKHNDGRYLHGAFRKDARELQFKVHADHWSPTALLVGGGNELISCLMTDEQNDILSFSLTCSEDRIPGHYKSPQEYLDIGTDFLNFMEKNPTAVANRDKSDEVLKLLRNFTTTF